MIAQTLRDAAERLRALAEAATPGPWCRCGSSIETRHECSPSHDCWPVADTWSGLKADGTRQHPDLIAEAVQAERGRIAAAIEWEAGGREAQALHARDEDVEFFGSKQRLTAEVKALRDAARIARDGGR